MTRGGSLPLRDKLPLTAVALWFRSRWLPLAVLSNTAVTNVTKTSPTKPKLEDEGFVCDCSKCRELNRTSDWDTTLILYAPQSLPVCDLAEVQLRLLTEVLQNVREMEVVQTRRLPCGIQAPTRQQ